MEQDLVIRQVWPAWQGRAAISPFEASGEFTQDCSQAVAVIAAPESDQFLALLRAKRGVERVLVVDRAEPMDSVGAVDGTAAPEGTGE